MQMRILIFFSSHIVFKLQEMQFQSRTSIKVTFYLVQKSLVIKWIFTEVVEIDGGHVASRKGRSSSPGSGPFWLKLRDISVPENIISRQYISLHETKWPLRRRATAFLDLFSNVAFRTRRLRSLFPQ